LDSSRHMRALLVVKVGTTSTPAALLHMFTAAHMNIQRHIDTTQQAHAWLQSGGPAAFLHTMHPTPKKRARQYTCKYTCMYFNP
jgi:hypothetical protein